MEYLNSLPEEERSDAKVAMLGAMSDEERAEFLEWSSDGEGAEDSTIFQKDSISMLPEDPVEEEEEEDEESPLRAGHRRAFEACKLLSCPTMLRIAVEEWPGFLDALLEQFLAASLAPASQAAWYLERIFRTAAQECREALLAALANSAVVEGFCNAVSNRSVQELLGDVMAEQNESQCIPGEDGEDVDGMGDDEEMGEAARALAACRRRQTPLLELPGSKELMVTNGALPLLWAPFKRAREGSAADPAPALVDQLQGAAAVLSQHKAEDVASSVVELGVVETLTVACEDQHGYWGGAIVQPIVEVLTRALCSSGDTEMALLREVTVHLPRQVKTLQERRVRNQARLQLTNYFVELAQHRLAAYVLVESGAVAACLQACVSRSECTLLHVATSRIVRGWIHQAMQALATRTDDDEETPKEIEQLFDQSQLIDMIGGMAGSVCPPMLVGHICSWVHLLQEWAEQEPIALAILTARAGDDGWQLLVNWARRDMPATPIEQELELRLREGESDSDYADTTSGDEASSPHQEISFIDNGAQASPEPTEEEQLDDDPEQDDNNTVGISAYIEESADSAPASEGAEGS